MGKLTIKETRIIAIALTSWGLILTGSGYVMKSMSKPKPIEKENLEIVYKRVNEVKSNEIKLKDIELEINKTLSVDVKDYLENIENIDSEVLKELKLDTSMIKTTEPGTYTYTVSYNKKKYNGTLVVKEKKLPDVELTINNLSLTVGSPLSTDKQVYIKETLTDEVKEHILIDLTQIDTQKPGNYPYTVTYNGILYTGTIEVYEPQQKVLTPSNGTEDDEETKKDETKEENQSN